MSGQSLNIHFTSRFKKEVKLAEKRGGDLAKLEKVIGLLRMGAALPARYRDHVLTGNWAGHRECHIEPDWLLIYVIDIPTLVLVRTGSHADLFD